jgi:sulfur carrier protein ThiS
MKVSVHILPTRKEMLLVELEDGSTVQQMILALGLYPDAWIAVRGEQPLPVDDMLHEGDEIRLFAVVSGG